MATGSRGAESSSLYPPRPAPRPVPRTLGDLGRGDHTCAVYADQQGRDDSLRPLAASPTPCCLVTRRPADDPLCPVLNPPDSVCLSDLQTLLPEFVREAQERWGPGVVVIIDVADLIDAPSAAAVCAYEQAAAATAAASEAAVVCLLDRRRLPDDLIAQALQSHSTVIVDGELHRQSLPAGATDHVGAPRASALDLYLRALTRTSRLRRYHRQQREARAALRDTTRQYRELVENAASIIVRTDLEGRLTFFNEFAEAFFGYGVGEVLGRSVVGLLVPEVDSEGRDLRRLLGEVLDAPSGAEDGETEVIVRDGGPAWVHWTLRVMRDDAGRPSGLLAVGVDIGDYKRAEQQLQESAQRLRDMTDLLPDMVCEISTEGVVTYANQAVFDSLGYGPADLLRPYHMLDLVPEDQVEKARAAFDRLLAGGSGAGQYNLKCKDGTCLPVEINSAPVLGHDGEVTGIRGVIRDISDRKELEEAQRMAALGQLAAGVAHEFNNILAAMLGWAELARNSREPETQRRLIDTVLTGASRGAEICKGLVSYARPVEPEQSVIAVSEPVQAALAIAARELDNANVIVDCDVETGDYCILGDPGQLEQVFLNLIINARHAMRGGGVLSIRAVRVPGGEHGEILVTVSDTGSGIKAGDLPRVFEPFFSTKTVDHSEYRGSGLGLSVSQSIVRAHGGTISVRSTEGCGATFSLRFAACRRSTLPATKSAPQTAEGTPGRGKVLLAEDERHILDVMRTALRAMGHEVLAVGTTEAALSALQTESFDLVITDLVMPGGGGAKLVSASQQLPAPPPVLLITGVVEESRLEQMMRDGVKSCLRKPFSLHELMQAVDELMSA